MERVDDIGPYLHWFATSGNCRPNSRMEVGEGLWPLLRWCWTRSPGERTDSALCRLLIGQAGSHWCEEDDVLEAMARNTEHANPSLQPLDAVGALAAAFVATGDEVRGEQPLIGLELDFLLPRVTDHPILETELIGAALRNHGMSPQTWRRHVEDVHTEREPYRGRFQLTLRSAGAPEGQAAAPARQQLSLPLSHPETGKGSRAGLTLDHSRELAAYFRLCATGSTT